MNRYQHTSQRWTAKTKHCRSEELVQDVGLLQILTRDEVWDNCIECRGGDSGSKPVDDAQHRQLPHVCLAAHDQDCHDEHRREAHDVSAEQNPPPLDPIAEDAATQERQKLWHGGTDSEHGQGRGSVRQGVRLPGQGDEVDAVTGK